MPDKRIVAAKMPNGHLSLIEQDIPELLSGAVLVEVHNSLISPGTELGGWTGLKRRMSEPARDVQPRPFGYSNAGVVIEVGPNVEDLKVGDRVACIGGGYARHTNYAVVPHNLCVTLDDRVSFAQGSYGMLAATALHAVRRLEPQFGEFAAVMGLGLIGQLAAQLLQLAGVYVLGWDTVAKRAEIARQWGINGIATVGADDPEAITRDFTGAKGLDAAIFAFGGDATAAYESTRASLKRTPDGHHMGRIVIVGGASVNMGWMPANLDIRTAGRTGPGYHDKAWEFGRDYPEVFMRWTTRTNLQLLMRLIAEGRLDVDCLTTHTIALENVDAEISAIIDEPDKILGAVFEMSHG